MQSTLELADDGRRAMSEQTRQVLCIFATGDFSRPVPPVPADWDEVYREVCRNGLLGLTHAYLTHQTENHRIPSPFRLQVRRAAAVEWLRLEAMYRKCLDVLARLAAAGIDALAVKGPAVAHTVYPDPSMRSFTDLDVVVREASWAAVHRLLLDLGFVPEQDLAEPPPKLVPQSSPYEWKYWHPRSQFLVEVHYEDLFNAGLASRDLAGVWERAIQVDVRGLALKVMALDDQLIHLCAHAHYHGFTRLGWFSDLAFLVRDHGDTLNWDRLLRTVRREDLQVPVYYALLCLEGLLGVRVPSGVLAALRPDRFRQLLHEHYLPTEKVLSLQPLPRPDFSFYFRPLFKRLLPDLLVMGRRRDKLAAMTRVIFPTDAWLRYYYRLEESQRVAPHRLLHPFKLAYHYANEVGTAASKLAWRMPRRLATVNGPGPARPGATREPASLGLFD